MGWFGKHQRTHFASTSPIASNCEFDSNAALTVPKKFAAWAIRNISIAYEFGMDLFQAFVAHENVDFLRESTIAVKKETNRAGDPVVNLQPIQSGNELEKRMVDGTSTFEVEAAFGERPIAVAIQLFFILQHCKSQ